MTASRAVFRSLFPAIGIGASLLAGCEPLPPRQLAPLEATAALQPAAPRTNAVIAGGHASAAVLEAPGRPAAPAPAPSTAPRSGAAGDVTLNFVDTDIREIARVILGTTLRVNYTIDPAVHGTATLEISRPLRQSELLSTLETLLNQNGATLSLSDGVYRVGPAGSLANVGSGPGSIGAGSEIVPLRYVAAKELVKVIEPFVAEGGKISADPGRNALIVSGNPTVRQALIAMVRAFDIDVLAHQSLALFPADEETPEKLAAEFEKVFRSDAEGPLSNVVRVVPMPRVNAVLVVTSQPRYIEEARRFYQLQRRAEGAAIRSWHVYYVQNGQSADLEALLQRAFTPAYVAATAPDSGMAPAGGRVTLSTNARSNPLGGTSPLGRSGPQVAGLPANESAGSNAPPPPLPPEPPPLAATPPVAPAENRIRIISNRQNNALLIYATRNEYAAIEGMLRKTDIVPLQVLIEATIAEVTLNDQLAYGTQFYLGNKVAGILTTAGPAIGTTAGTTAAGTTATPGAIGPTTVTVGGTPVTLGANFPGFVVANGVREVLNALSAVTQVKVLSSPRLMVLDNQPAKLQVGQQVPILTGTATSTLTTGAPIVNSIDYHATGVIMQVTPRVNSGGLVTLEIAQEVSDVAPPAANTAAGSPTFDDRVVQTRVAVQDGQTLALAGLIRDNSSESNSGIPFLKDVPVLGSLFSSQQNSRQRTELLVLITPHVVHDQRDARLLTEDLRNQLLNAGLVRQDLQARPPSGSPNPNGL